MKVFGEEAEPGWGAHVLPPCLGLAGVLPGAPVAWLQLWQTVMYLFFSPRLATFPPQMM